MRIWSLHPKHLDAKGIVALWRETLLAKHVLLGKTKGYTQHPQLHRFKKLPRPAEAIDQYLAAVCEAAEARGYRFDRSKIDWNFTPQRLPVTAGQVEFETQHLLKKLAVRDPQRHREVLEKLPLDLHPMFEVVPGEIETWEIV